MAAWPFQAEDFSPLAWGIPNWAVKPCPFSGGVSYTGSEIINVHKTKEQREHNKTLFPNPNQNNNGSFVLCHLSPVHESLPFSYS